MNIYLKTCKFDIITRIVKRDKIIIISSLFNVDVP